jgi:hypothetical protein
MIVYVFPSRAVLGLGTSKDQNMLALLLADSPRFRLLLVLDPSFNFEFNLFEFRVLFFLVIMGLKGSSFFGD